MTNEVLSIALFVGEVLERMGVRHVVSGSLASSLHGIPRATQDIDFVADLQPNHAAEIVAALQPRFYVDSAAVAEAIRDRTRFNAIHLETMFKVDIYVPEMNEVARAQFQRGTAFEFEEEGGQTLVVASAEDTVLQKLRWYLLGDETSERQWRDALGVIRVQGPRLDREYLAATAASMGLMELLERALTAGSDRPPGAGEDLL